MPREFADTEKHRIEFLNSYILLPNQFKKSNLEEFESLVNSDQTNSEYASIQLNGLKNIKKYSPDLEIFIDKNNYSNTISFELGETVEFDEGVVPYYSYLLENQLQISTSKTGIKYESLESDFIKLKYLKAIKLKFKQTFDGNVKYFTQYIISYKLKTFNVIVTNIEDLDYQFILQSFSN
ncbi:hypothetical protein BWR22_09445 [Lacinutrix venerupis]|uniref:Uncharacterized protein n=1 Tax=Lacinutrix venerupis TaxID=1486034 RepID=A0AAC9PX76_9FLAO|nr:hypothetical protein BWR22_09445 [Lacinutrix venerupis]